MRTRMKIHRNLSLFRLSLRFRRDLNVLRPTNHLLDTRMNWLIKRRRNELRSSKKNEALTLDRRLKLLFRVPVQFEPAISMSLHLTSMESRLTQIHVFHARIRPQSTDLMGLSGLFLRKRNSTH